MANEAFQAVRTVLHADRSIAAAIVYGSGARGQLRADSDLDLAVLYSSESARAAANQDLLAQLGALGSAAGRDVHLVDLQTADSALRRSIFSHGIRLFDRSNGALQQLERATAVEYVDWEYARGIIDAGLRRRLEHTLG